LLIFYVRVINARRNYGFSSKTFRIVILSNATFNGVKIVFVIDKNSFEWGR